MKITYKKNDVVEADFYIYLGQKEDDGEDCHYDRYIVVTDYSRGGPGALLDYVTSHDVNIMSGIETQGHERISQVSYTFLIEDHKKVRDLIAYLLINKHSYHFYKEEEGTKAQEWFEHLKELSDAKDYYAQHDEKPLREYQKEYEAFEI